MLQVSVYRYNPDRDAAPYIQDFQVDAGGKDMMILDVLALIKEQDEGFSYRRSYREGVYDPDDMNINGKNGLACITPLSAAGLKSGKLVVRPLPGLPVIRDLIVGMSIFYRQYEKVEPFLQNDTPIPAIERLQIPKEREELDGLYECILCACCSTSCPSFWWNPDKFLGPAALLRAYHFLADSRDTKTEERLASLDDPFSVLHCRGIMNCANACPKGLNPTKVIGHVRNMLLQSRTRSSRSCYMSCTQQHLWRQSSSGVTAARQAKLTKPWPRFEKYGQQGHPGWYLSYLRDLQWPYRYRYLRTSEPSRLHQVVVPLPKVT